MLRRRAAFGRPVPARAASLVAVAVVTSLAGATGAIAVGSGSAATVVLKDIAFHRAVTRIHPGQRVTFTWKDPYVTHNVHAVGRLRFPGASARQSGSYSIRLSRKGTYRYECTLHPGMKGSIVVG